MPFRAPPSGPVPQWYRWGFGFATLVAVAYLTGCGVIALIVR
jgi:hypothetical protein